MKRKPILPIFALLGIAAILFVALVLPPLRNASIAKAVRRNLVARGYGDVESSLKDRHVFLWGRSKTAEERSAVASIARNVPGVAGVSNYTGIEDDLADAVATSESLRDELGATLARLEETGQKLDAMSQRAAGLDADLSETRTSLAETTTALSDTETTLAQRTEDLAAFKAAWSRDKAELELALDDQKSANARLRETLANSEILLAEARRVLGERDREYARESGQLMKTLADLGTRLRTTESGLAGTAQGMKAEVTRATQLKGELEAATSRMAALEAKSADTEKLLAEARRVLAVRNQEFTAQSEKLAATETALEALKQQLEKKAEESPSSRQDAFPRQFYNSF